MRISNVFKNFLNEFNSKTIRDSNITLYDLKVKYLSTLETLTWGLGRETVEPRSLRVCGEGEVSPTHTSSMGDEAQAYEVQVCGTTGISWRKKLQQVSDIVHIIKSTECRLYIPSAIWTLVYYLQRAPKYQSEHFFHLPDLVLFPPPLLVVFRPCHFQVNIVNPCLILLPEQNALALKDKSKSRKTKTDSRQKSDKKNDASSEWIPFSDFHEITHIVAKEAGVTIYRQDNKTMVNSRRLQYFSNNRLRVAVSFPACTCVGIQYFSGLATESR